MRNKQSRSKESAERVVKDIRRKTRRQFSAEEKIRIVLEGLRGDDSIAELCRKEGIAQSLYYTWSKEFMEAGKRRLAGDTARAATSDEVKNLRREAHDLKEVVAEQTLDKLGIARRTFYRWYDRYLEGGPEALADRPSAPSRVWNRIPARIHDQIIEMALEQSELSPRELAVRFTDERRYFVSEASVYRLLKAHDLITSPAYTVIKATDRFHTPTTRVNEMWQTDFTYFKIIGWGCRILWRLPPAVSSSTLSIDRAR